MKPQEKVSVPKMVMRASSAPSSSSSGAATFSLLSPSMIGQTDNTKSSGYNNNNNNNQTSPHDFFQALVNKSPFLTGTSEAISSMWSPQNSLNNKKTIASSASKTSSSLPMHHDHRLSRNEMIHQLIQADDCQQWQKFQEALRQRGAITESRLVHDLENVLREQMQEQQAIIRERSQKERQKQQEQQQRQEQSRGENEYDDSREEDKARGGQHHHHQAEEGQQGNIMIQSHDQNDEELPTNPSAVEQKRQNQYNWHNNLGFRVVKMFLSDDEEDDGDDNDNDDDDSEDENPKESHHHDIIISSASSSRDLPPQPSSPRRSKMNVDPPPSSESTATTTTVEERRGGRGMIIRSLSRSPTQEVQRGGASQETGRRRGSMDLFRPFASSSATSSFPRRVISLSPQPPTTATTSDVKTRAAA